MHACLFELFSEMEASLAEYLMEQIKSSDGKPLLKNMIPNGKILQLPKEKATLFYKKYTYVTQFNESIMLNNPSNEIYYSAPLPLPEGYSIGVLKPRDGKLVRHCWSETAKDHTKDEQQFEHIISTLPTSAVFHKDDPEVPVGWILAYPFGRIGHVFIDKSHRDKKLFPAIAQDLCKKTLQLGIIPEMVTKESRVIAAAIDAGFVHCGNSHRLYVDRDTN